MSPKAISCAPASASRARDLEHALARDDALVRAAEARRDDRLDAQPGVARARDDPLEAVERRGDRAVDVAQVVRLGRRQEDADLVEALAQLERVVQAARVRDEHAARDAVRDVDRRQHLARVGELRDDVGAHEARDLDAPQPGAREPVDQRDLVGGRDDLRLVLQAVARADLADRDASCRQHGSRAQPAGDHHLLDLVGPLADRQDLRVAVHAADRILLDVAVAAVDLHGLVGAADGEPAGLELRLRGGEAERPAGVLQQRGAVDEQPRRPRSPSTMSASLPWIDWNFEIGWPNARRCLA